jgi:hypothetical protein
MIYFCDECDKCFTSNDYLRKHMARSHTP